jgi:hypothetical protein
MICFGDVDPSGSVGVNDIKKRLQMREVNVCKGPLVAVMFLDFVQVVLPHRRRRGNGRVCVCGKVDSALHRLGMLKLGCKVFVQSEDEIAAVDTSFPLLLLPKLFQILRAKMNGVTG